VDGGVVCARIDGESIAETNALEPPSRLDVGEHGETEGRPAPTK